MRVFSRIGFNNVKKFPVSASKLVEQFYESANQYMIHKETQLYRVPWNSKSYEYVKEIKTIVKDGGIFELVEREFTKAEYARAVAYRFQLGSFIHTYNDICPGYYFERCCEGGSVLKMQIKHLMVPKGSFKNKEYGITDLLTFAVSERLMNEIIGLGASEHDFMPVVTKQGEVVCYQIEPVNTLFGLSEINHWRKESGCPKCNYPIYWQLDGKATLISDKLLSELKILNKTEELLGDVNIAAYFINKELYEYLHVKYPRMYFVPIFSESNAPAID